MTTPSIASSATIATPLSDAQAVAVTESIQDQRDDYVAQQAVQAASDDLKAQWMQEAVAKFPDPTSVPTVTFSNGGKLRRVGQTLEGCPVGSSDWQPVMWLTVADLSLFAQLVPSP